MARIVTGYGQLPGPACALADGCSACRRSMQQLDGCPRHTAAAACAGSWTRCTDLSELIDRAIVDDPPFTMREGGMIRDGYSQEMDESAGYHDRRHRRPLPPIEAREREETGIHKLKVGYNRVFGYYIEVTNSQHRPGARRLHPQADPDQLRALHHPGAQGPGRHAFSPPRTASVALEYRAFSQSCASYLADQLARVQATATGGGRSWMCLQLLCRGGRARTTTAGPTVDLSRQDLTSRTAAIRWWSSC